MKKLEKTLMEELARYNAINKYTKTLMEQGEVPPPDIAPPAPDMGAEGDIPPPAPTDVAAPAPEDMSAPVDDTEEIDITDLVNMTKSIKKDLDDSKSDSTEVAGKMDTVFTKLTDLENKLSQMDMVMNKIDELGQKMDTMKEKTPQEKLELRSLDSYPFNQNPQQFFAQKQPEMAQSGKNEYVLTKQDIDDYSTDIIRNSFNGDEDEFSF